MDPAAYFVWKQRNEQRERVGPIAEVVYPNVITGFRPIARKLGYAICAHGSGKRDLDLVACPWVVDSVAPDVLIQHLRCAVPGCMLNESDPERKPHGRLAWELHFWCGDNLLTIDISVMPKAELL